ncbi:MAG: OmpH family outer membrane protein [Thermotogae bacterium]|nr:OmpH family outer membrane protein [Thermotogota bacterium]
MVLTFLLSQTFRVAFIDMARIYENYIDLRDAREQVMRYKATLEIRRDSLRMKLDTLQRNLMKQWPMLTDAEKILRWQEIEATKRALDSVNRFIIRQVEAKSKEVMAPYLKKVRETAEKIAKDMGYSAILDIGSALWVDPQHDITTLVLDELNRAHKSAGLILKKTLIFPFKEEDSRVDAWNLGDSAQLYIYNDLNGNPKLDIMEPRRINDVLRSRGYTWKTIDERAVFSVAQAFAPDIYIFGGIKSKSDDQVDVWVALYDGRTGEIIRVGDTPLKQTYSDIRRGIEFQNIVVQAARQLINRYLSQFGG